MGAIYVTLKRCTCQEKSSHCFRYVLKPSFMCRADKTFDPFVESTVDGIIAGAVTVKVIAQ